MQTAALQSSPQRQPGWLMPALNGLMQPVAARARASRAWWNGWQDPAAERLVRMHREIGGQVALSKAGYSDRARRLDEQALAVLSQENVDAVVEIGCGLSTRSQRLGSALPWFGLDDVPLYRCWSCFFQECERWRFIPAGQPQRHWLQYLRRRCCRPLVIMEGHGVCVAPALAARWQRTLAEHFPEFCLVGASLQSRRSNAPQAGSGRMPSARQPTPSPSPTILSEGA